MTLQHSNIRLSVFAVGTTTVLLLILLLVQQSSTVHAGIPFLPSRKRYTPLVFFKVPQGSIPECDEMEVVVKQVERELGVHVERLDVARDPTAQATLNLLTQHSPPYLYHRESLQSIFVQQDPLEKKSHKKKSNDDDDDNAKAVVPKIDKDRVRAWAKGRYLPPPGVKFGMSASKKAPVVVSQEDNAMDQEELEAIKDMSLTPEQLEGKQAMEKRTAKRAQKTLR
ncbi:hypothetical protein IV203_019539 [Nitzschia inconspicua]|uniref:Uncharacterized protein n=1 Tax=Nitzschia inconspicua TaxID=303405 RepID=A0A9K3LYN6_9STRA|nr:hypothetical protein IV203_019539 [Nitzschia inconspicua]